MRVVLIAILLSCGTLFAQTTLEVTQSVYFASASDKLDREAKQVIRKFTEDLSGYADFTVKLAAYTDEQGTVVYNEDLAARRAETVKRYLEKVAVSTESWSVVAYGERMAKTNTADDDDRKADRRVDMVATLTTWSDVSEVAAALQSGLPQSFTVDPGLPQTVRGDKGGRFLIEANSFVDAEGRPVTGLIDISLVEAYEMGDMLLAGLTTTSGDRLLETGGMFELTATDEEGNPVFLADGKTIASSIPTSDYDEQMRIFNGRFHEEEEGTLDWELTPQGVTNAPAGLLSNLYEGPMLIRWKVDGREAFAVWKKNNPEPELKLRPVPSLRKVPVMPDTAAIQWEPSLVNGLFASREKRKRMRKALVDKALERFAHEQKVHRKRVQIAKENAAFNLEAKAAFPDLKKAWAAAAQAERQRIADENKERNDVLNADYERRRAAWYAKREATLTASLSEDDLSGKARDLNRYFFTINKLGWINCDVFYEEEDPVMVQAVVPETGEGTKVILIPEGRQAMLPYFFKSKGTWATDGIPRGTQYQVFAYQINNGQLQYAQQIVAAAGTEAEVLVFSPISVEGLKESLLALGQAK